MVKNAQGGNKSKGFARKGLVKKEGMLRVSHEECEIYAQAVKIMGGAIASAIDTEGNALRVHIRGKFRGRGKRDNFISPNTWLLVGIHEWQAKPTSANDIRNCDLLEVYSDTDKVRLKNSVTNINWNKFIANDTKSHLPSDCPTSTNDNSEGFVFADDVTQEYEELIEAEALKTGKTIVVVNDALIDVDDI